MTKIDIISGFLGAGKTTLIKKLIKEALSGQKIVLIENEFGDIGIDGGFLRESGIEITEMNSGCICCSLVGDFGQALKEVITKYAPDRIIIEPSGVGKLSDVIKAVVKVKEEFSEVELNSFTAVADAGKTLMYMKNFGEFFNDQIENASTIVLSRSQKISEEKLEAAVAAIKEHNDKAVVITTDWDLLTGKQILNAMEQGDSLLKELIHEEEHHHHHEDGECCCHHHGEEEHEHHHHEDGECCCHRHGEEEHEHHHHEDGECCCHHHEEEHEHHHHEDGECCCHHDDEEHGHHHHHHADEVFDSWGVTTPKKYSEDELDRILDRLANEEGFGIILRAKGIVPCDGGWLEFDLTPGEYEVRSGSPDITGKLCVIGSKLDKDKIKGLFGF